MDTINKLRVFNKLKNVYRLCTVGNRKESTAEHTWSCLILADFFLSQMKSDLDRLKVYELLMYHDVVEIEAGDTPIHPDVSREDKEKKEKKAAKSLHKQLPPPLNDKFVALFNEFEEAKSMEAKFAKAIDAMEAEIHELDYKEDWKGWTKEFLIEKKKHYFVEFPELMKTFDIMLDYLIENNYLDQ